ncbi:MAG: energy-coupling factor transporter ATPase [Eubacteriaceae bacterium]|nr:energy-coupling factor transporter ATPase [Eubacteriaceae bacterium]
MKTMIRLEAASFSYDEADSSKTALDDINLEFCEGEFIGIAGHNGSGKSTLAKLLNGLLLPTKGDVTVLGMNTKNENEIKEIRRNVGMVFQNPDNQMIATIVEEDVAFGPENLGKPPYEIRDTVDESLALVGMAEYKDKRPSQLSGGQKQRIAIAGVLAMKPKCIIFDESTAMLDPQGRKELLDTMHRLNAEEGVTIIHITHYMEELITASRIIALNEGKVAFDKTPRDAFSDLSALSPLNLAAPEVVQIADGLKIAGFPIEGTALSCEELVEAIWQLKQSL